MQVEWNRLDIEIQDENERTEFRGQRTYNPVTEKFDLRSIFPFRLKLLKYLKSFLISSPFLFVAVLMMIIFLNLHGYMRGKKRNPLYIDVFSKMSEEGAIFDPSTNRGLIITIAQPIITLLWNNVYKYLLNLPNL